MQKSSFDDTDKSFLLAVLMILIKVFPVLMTLIKVFYT